MRDPLAEARALLVKTVNLLLWAAGASYRVEGPPTWARRDGRIMIVFREVGPGQTADVDHLRRERR